MTGLLLLPLAIFPDFGSDDERDNDEDEFGDDQLALENQTDIHQPNITDDVASGEPYEGAVLQPEPDEPDEPGGQDIAIDPLLPHIEDDDPFSGQRFDQMQHTDTDPAGTENSDYGQAEIHQPGGTGPGPSGIQDGINPGGQEIPDHAAALDAPDGNADHTGNLDNGSDDPVEIPDFETSADVFEITLEPGGDATDVDIGVTPSADGEDGEVYLNDDLIAVLKGAPDATVANVALVFS